jgi:hypothetical protein
MWRRAAVLAGLAALACASASGAPTATGCSFTGARWQQDGTTGRTYAVTVLRGVTCARATILAAALTHKHSRGPNLRVPSPQGWLCLSFTPRGSLVSRGACARLGRRVAWQPTGGTTTRGGPTPPKKPKPKA